MNKNFTGTFFGIRSALNENPHLFSFLVYNDYQATSGALAWPWDEKYTCLCTPTPEKVIHKHVGFMHNDEVKHE